MFLSTSLLKNLFDKVSIFSSNKNNGSLTFLEDIFELASLNTKQNSSVNLHKKSGRLDASKGNKNISYKHNRKTSIWHVEIVETMQFG